MDNGDHRAPKQIPPNTVQHSTAAMKEGLSVEASSSLFFPLSPLSIKRIGEARMFVCVCVCVRAPLYEKDRHSRQSSCPGHDDCMS